MAIWPFNRKDQTSDLPQEVQDYYQAEKREKVGVAGLLALGTLVVTILLAIALFFGGRWVYRTVFDNGSDNNVAQQDDQDDQSDEGALPAETPEGNQSEDNDQEEAHSDDQPEEDQPEGGDSQQTPSTPSTPTETPSTGGDDLPSTGPADSLAIFVGTVVVAGSVYCLTRRPQEN